MNVPVPVPTLAPATPAEPTRFDAVSIRLHWLTAILVAVQFASAWSIDRMPNGSAAEMTLTVHRSSGALLLAILAARLFWRLGRASRPPLNQMNRAQKTIALGVEALLYGLLLAQPVTGIGESLARGKPFFLFVLQVPAVMARDKPLAHLLGEAHETTAKILLALIALHAAAALVHGFVLRDGVLSSMLPMRKRAETQGR